MAYDTRVDKVEAWKHLPIRHADLSLDDAVFEGLKREGKILSDTDLESKQRSLDLKYSLSGKHLGRSRDLTRTINGRKYLVKKQLDGLHMDPLKYDSATVDRTLYWPVNPNVLERETDFVDILRDAIENSQAVSDMYKTPSEKRHRKRRRGF